ncbi:MAG: hypothetical protein M3389_06630 [Actinomycetota bacterium]|nr:hypothetical protein [Actinomycetota bacterium]
MTEDPGGLTPEQREAVDRFWREHRHRLADLADALPWEGGTEARQALARKVEAERAGTGSLSKDTFDRVLRWGFGRGSTLTEEEINHATREAFASLARGDATGAVNRLRQLRGIGVSRATKVLALADEANLGIYDSHAAAALQSITQDGKPLVPVPPGKSRQVRGLPTASQDQLAEAYPTYTAVLRRLLENAQKDRRFGKRFRRVADIEKALFASSRGGSSTSGATVGQEAGALGTHTGARAPTGRTGRAAVFGAAPGALRDARALLDGSMTPRTFLRRRAGEGARAGAVHVFRGNVERIGKAESLRGAHAQAGARAGVVNFVAGGLVDAPALIRGEMRPRDFLEHRGLDFADGGGTYLVAAGVALAPVEAPAAAAGAVVIGGGLVVSAGVNRVRRRVQRAQDARASRRRSEAAQSDDQAETERE